MNKEMQSKYYQEMMLRARLTGILSGMIKWGDFTPHQKKVMATCLLEAYKAEGMSHDSALNTLTPELEAFIK